MSKSDMDTSVAVNLQPLHKEPPGCPMIRKVPGIRTTSYQRKMPPSTVLRSRSADYASKKESQANPSLHSLIGRARRGIEGRNSASMNSSPANTQSRQVIKLDVSNIAKQHGLLDKEGMEMTQEELRVHSLLVSDEHQELLPAHSNYGLSQQQEEEMRSDAAAMTSVVLKETAGMDMDLFKVPEATTTLTTGFSEPLLKLPDPSSEQDRWVLFAISRKLCSRSLTEPLSITKSNDGSFEEAEAEDGIESFVPDQYMSDQETDDLKSLMSAEDFPDQMHHEGNESIAFSMDSVCIRKQQYQVMDSSQRTDWAVGCVNHPVVRDPDGFALEEFDEIEHLPMYVFDMASVHLGSQHEAARWNQQLCDTQEDDMEM